MNQQELAKVVARIQAGDNRTVDRITMAHWQETIGHLDGADALTAVAMHFRESTEYLMPAHIVSICKRLAEDRVQRAALEDGGPIGAGAPEPHNLAAMVAAHDDPVEFRRQAAIYNRQLVDAGYAIDKRYPVADEVA